MARLPPHAAATLHAAARRSASSRRRGRHQFYTVRIADGVGDARVQGVGRHHQHVAGRRLHRDCRRTPRRVEAGTISSKSRCSRSRDSHDRFTEDDCDHHRHRRSARRHIFLCCDQTKPKCCDKERGLVAWDFLKKRLNELGLVRPGRHPAHEGELPSHLRRRPDRRRLSRKARGTASAIRRRSSGSSRNTSIAGRVVSDYLIHQHPLPQP